jgi:UDP-N-acetylglucosamine enolpyruvyl transferase
MKRYLRILLTIALVIAAIASQGVIGIENIGEESEIVDSPRIISEGEFALETCGA